MSDVTSRTLRHYDAIGLLPPAWIGADGRRYYRRPELLRLQRILLLRELGLGLAAIAEALEREADPVAVLRTHRDRLAGERDRLEDRIGYRLRSRLYEMCLMVPLRGNDFRKDVLGTRIRSRF